MITIAEALEKVSGLTGPIGTEHVSLPQLIRRRLAEPLLADVDSPPHDKSLMDGYAVRSADVVRLPVELKLLETVTAGEVPQQAVKPGTATRVMTGAPIPIGADCVVMVENTSPIAGPEDVQTAVLIERGEYSTHQHLLKRGRSMRAGELIFDRGHLLRPHDLGLLAEIGQTHVLVYRRPGVAVISTGNELVAPELRPGPGCIRNSNGPLLASLARSSAREVLELGVARDDLGELCAKIRAAESAELVVLSGGVSEGLADLVPRALGECGFKEVFHKVSIKPGKPIWFGISERDGRRRWAFGLPGNPVSSLVCFEIFVRVAIERLSGNSLTQRTTHWAKLGEPHSVRGPRPTWWPANLIHDPLGAAVVHPLQWHGSSDLRYLGAADCLAFFPSRNEPYGAGELVRVLPLLTGR
ncbi:MAG: gephyrin-like molybdotransferase Glp [Planctomycetota bacterium]